MDIGTKEVEYNLAIVEAVENLSTIAELDLASDVGITEPHVLELGGGAVPYRMVHWLQRDDLEVSLGRVKGVFLAIVSFVRQFYEQQQGTLYQHRTIENIRRVMELISEAAGKIDRFASLEQGRSVQSITESPEVRELKHYYDEHIAPIDAERLTLGPIVPARLSQRGAKISLARRKGIKNMSVELASALRDENYELFYLRKEGGKSFFGADLIRNLKLVMDFEGQVAMEKGVDPLIKVHGWRDRARQTVAKQYLLAVNFHLEEFYSHYAKYKKMEFAVLINKAVMALMMAANQHNLLRNSPVKSCAAYFADFLNFIRAALNTREYGRLQKYPPTKNQRPQAAMLDLLNQLCRALYSIGQAGETLGVIGEQLYDQWHQEVPSDSTDPGGWITELEQGYGYLTALLEAHPHGPLYRVLEDLERNRYKEFDSLHQDNVPARLFSLFYAGTKVVGVRIGSPTRQRYVDRASVTQEFKAFIQALGRSSGKKKHLLVNLQDRTGWREFHRCRELEEYPEDAKVKRHLSVITLAKNTDWYHQRAPYHEVYNADAFKETIIEQVLGEGTGFYFPPMIQRGMTQKFLRGVVEGIHAVFFDGSDQLRRRQRLDFIELVYYFVVMRALELSGATSISMTCKDGLDSGISMSIGFYFFVKMINVADFPSVDRQYARNMLHGPVLLTRERAIHPDVFERLINALRCVQKGYDRCKTKQAFLGKVTKRFTPCFDTDIVRNATVRPPRETRTW
jgi:hypothetical protein